MDRGALRRLGRAIAGSLALLALAFLLSVAAAAIAVIAYVIGRILRRPIRRAFSEHWFSRNRGESVAVGVAVAALVAGSLYPDLGFVRRFARAGTVLPRVDVNYRGSLAWRGSSTPWEFRESVVIPWRVWLPREVLSSPEQPAATEMGRQRGRRAMDERGWRLTGTVDSGDEFERVSEIAVVQRWFPASTTTSVPLAVGKAHLPQSHANLVMAPDSEVVVRCAKYIVGATFPPCASRTDMLRDGEEELVVPVSRADRDEPGLRLELLSPLLRWELGPKLASLTPWAAVHWAILGLLAFVWGVASDEIKRVIVQPITDRLVRRRRARTSTGAER